MKFFAIILAILAMASYAAAAAAVEPTPAPALVKRADQFPNAVDISALLADPKSYLASVSKEVKQHGTKYAALWAKATNNPQYHASISSALKDTFGSKTAHIAMAQFTSKVAEAKAIAASSSAQVAAAVQTPVAAAAAAAESTSADSPISSAVQQITGSFSSGAGSTVSTNYVMALTFALVPAIVVALL